MGNFPYYPHADMVVIIEPTIRNDQKYWSAFKKAWTFRTDYKYPVVCAVTYNGEPCARLKNAQDGRELVVALRHIKPTNMSQDDLINYLSFHLPCVCGKKYLTRQENTLYCKHEDSMYEVTIRGKNMTVGYIWDNMFLATYDKGSNHAFISYANRKQDVKPCKDFMEFGELVKRLRRLLAFF